MYAEIWAPLAKLQTLVNLEVKNSKHNLHIKPFWSFLQMVVHGYFIWLTKKNKLELQVHTLPVVKSENLTC